MRDRCKLSFPMPPATSRVLARLSRPNRRACSQASLQEEAPAEYDAKRVRKFCITLCWLLTCGKDDDGRLFALFRWSSLRHFVTCYVVLRAVPLQSVESKLGRTGESKMAVFFVFFSLASIDFLAPVTILRDCLQSTVICLDEVSDFFK